MSAPLYNVWCGMCGDIIAERVTSAVRRSKRHKALEKAHADACHERQLETAVLEGLARMTGWSRERKISWLCALDPNGNYRSEKDPPTDAELDAAIEDTLREA